MPRAKVNLNSVELGEAAVRFLETKRQSTREAYDKCLKRFAYYYGDELERFIGEIEDQIEANDGKPLANRIRPGESVIRGFIRWHEENGYAPKSTRQGIAALQNALKYYGIIVSFDFIELPPDRPLLENEKHQWTLEEIKSFVESADYLRDKAFILTAFQSGLSLSDVIDLDYEDIKRENENRTLPLLIHKYRRKTGVEVKTFLGRDAVHYLDIYLKTREALKKDSPLFAMLGNEKRVTKAAIQKMLRQYARKADFILDDDMDNGFNPARPHSLRSAFRSRLTGKMDNTLIEFFMGHQIGPEIKTYINMPEDELRELYSNYEHLLAIEKTSKEELLEAQPHAIPEHFRKQLEDVQKDNTLFRIEVAELQEKVTKMEKMLEYIYEQSKPKED